MGLGVLDGFFKRDVFWAVPLFGTCLPITRLLPAKDDKFQRTATSDAAELACSEFLVVLPFEPENETVLVTVIVNQREQCLAIKPLQN